MDDVLPSLAWRDVDRPYLSHLWALRLGGDVFLGWSFVALGVVLILPGDRGARESSLSAVGKGLVMEAPSPGRD